MTLIYPFRSHQPHHQHHHNHNSSFNGIEAPQQITPSISSLSISTADSSFTSTSTVSPTPTQSSLVGSSASHPSRKKSNWTTRAKLMDTSSTAGPGRLETALNRLERGGTTSRGAGADTIEGNSTTRGTGGSGRRRPARTDSSTRISTSTMARRDSSGSNVAVDDDAAGVSGDATGVSPSSSPSSSSGAMRPGEEREGRLSPTLGARSRMYSYSSEIMGDGGPGVSLGLGFATGGVLRRAGGSVRLPGAPASASPTSLSGLGLMGLESGLDGFMSNPASTSTSPPTSRGSSSTSTVTLQHPERMSPSSSSMSMNVDMGGGHVQPVSLAAAASASAQLTWDMEDWDDLKELFNKTTELYDAQPPSETMPLLRAVIHECHRFMLCYEDPSTLFVGSGSEKGSPSEELPPSAGLGGAVGMGMGMGMGGMGVKGKGRERKESRGTSPGSVRLPAAPAQNGQPGWGGRERDSPLASLEEEMMLRPMPASGDRERDAREKERERDKSPGQCKCTDLPTAFHTLLGTTLFYFGNLIAQDPELALPGEPKTAIPYFLAALDVFETGENLPIKTSGRGCKGVPEDWRMAVVWGRVLVCIAEEVLSRQRAASGSIGSPPISPVPGPFASSMLNPQPSPYPYPYPYSQLYASIPATSTFNSVPTLPAQTVTYGTPVASTAFNAQDLFRTFGLPDPSAAGDMSQNLEDDPVWPPHSPFALIASRRPPVTRRMTLSETTPSELLVLAQDQFSRGIFHMPHPATAAGVGLLHGSGNMGGVGVSVTPLPPMGPASRESRHSPHTESHQHPRRHSPSGEATGSQPSSGLSVSTAGSAPFSRAKELYTIAAEVLLLAEALPAARERANWAKWADSVFAQMRMEADVHAWRGLVMRARGRCALLVGEAAAEDIEAALEAIEESPSGEGGDHSENEQVLSVLRTEDAQDARENLQAAISFLEKAREEENMEPASSSGQTEEEKAEGADDLKRLLAEALLTLANVTESRRERERLYKRAKEEGGDVVDIELDGSDDMDTRDDGEGEYGMDLS
ncbi:hypothetical protein BJ165DRAFT_1407782 [Panaeolus papilionaceus]|nr:hypothetical protein BJ165DRAFT_1407782 [Panaeolus papilionaceus]